MEQKALKTVLMPSWCGMISHQCAIVPHEDGNTGHWTVVGENAARVAGAATLRSWAIRIACGSCAKHVRTVAPRQLTLPSLISSSGGNKWCAPCAIMALHGPCAAMGEPCVRRYMGPARQWVSPVRRCMSPVRRCVSPAPLRKPCAALREPRVYDPSRFGSGAVGPTGGS